MRDRVASRLVNERSVHTQTTHTAVGKDAEAKGRSDAGVEQFLIEEVTRVCLEFCARQNGGPWRRWICQSFDVLVFGVARFEQTAFGEVAFEVRRVDFDTPRSEEHTSE